MKETKIKLKEVFLPFILVSVGTFIIYNLFRWTFDIKLNILPLKEDLLDYWIPVIISMIVVLIWLRKRVRILNISGEKNNGYSLYVFLMGFAIAIPLFLSQDYLKTNAYELIELNSSQELLDYKNEKYFTMDSYNVDLEQSYGHITARSTDKNNRELTLFLYVVSPMDSSGSNIWFGKEYSKRINNNLSDPEKDNILKSFINEIENKYEKYDFSKIQYFEKVRYSDSKDGFLNAIKEYSKNINSKKQIILTPVTENFEERSGSSFNRISIPLTISYIVLLLMCLIPKVDRKQYERFKQNKTVKDDDLLYFLRTFNPLGEYKATSSIFILNVLVFIIMIFAGFSIISPTGQKLLEIGANRRSEVISGDYWRLLTSVFIHGGLMHLVANMFGLYIGGMIVEKVIGPVRFIIIYLICGILASLTSIYWHDHTISVGASGAIFGVYGLILAFTIFKVFPDSLRRLNWLLLGLYVGVSLLFGLTKGIDNAAHIGGLLSGFILGSILTLFSKSNLKNNAEEGSVVYIEDSDMQNYILNYFSKFLTEKEAKAIKHDNTLSKMKNIDDKDQYEKRKSISLEKGWLTDDPEILALLKDGIDSLTEKATGRIVKEHSKEIFFNFCPECGKLARTPKAKQCRFCGHDWH
jgi:rhomboid protease GluP